MNARLGIWLWSLLGSVFAAILLSPLARAETPGVSPDTAQHVETAIEVFDGLVKHPLPPRQRALLEEALKDAHGFVIFPKVLKAGAGVSTIQGRGVLSYRDRDGEWSPPVPLLVQGTSTGPHFGAVFYDTLAVIKTPDAVARLLSGPQRLEGREATGPIQQAVSPQQDIVSYSRYLGLTVGLSVDDIHVSLDRKAIHDLYGRDVEPREIIGGEKLTLRRPPCAQKFVENVNRVAGKSPVTSYWK